MENTFADSEVRDFNGLSAPITPDTVDWRNTPLVLPVRNINNCGACYSISSIEAVEAAVAFAKGSVV